MQIDPRIIAQEEHDKHRALQRGLATTVGMVRRRRRPPNRPYRPGRLHLELGAVCDSFTAACIQQRGPWCNLSAPVRHGKTEHVARGMPVRAMALQPGFSVLYGTSTDERVEEVSHAVRTEIEILHQEFGIEHLAPGRKWSVREWETVGGNTWNAVGVGKSTGGIGANMVILDDTTGSASRARSAAFRRDQRRWLEEDMLSRLMNGGGMMNMETRRGVYDLHAYLEEKYGRHIKTYNWPLICDEIHLNTDPKREWRSEGEYLWPADGEDIRYGAEWHAQHPEVSGLLLSQLYQGRPLPEGGGMYAPAVFDHRYALPPRALAAVCSDRWLAIDPAATEGGGDNSVISVFGRWGDGKMPKLHQARGQWSYTTLEQRTRDLMSSWSASVAVVEGTSNGRALRDRLVMLGIPCIMVGAAGSKYVKARPTFPAREQGLVPLPQVEHAPWVAEYQERMEVLTGQGDEVDDESDADVIGIKYGLGMHGNGKGPPTTQDDISSILDALEQGAQSAGPW
jgi:hypothetical protein